MKYFRIAAFYFAVMFMSTIGLVAAPNLLKGSDNEDVGLSILQTVPAEFPHSVLLKGLHSGKVRVVVSIDANGQLVDHLVVAYTHEDFVAAAVNAVKSWVYEPAKVRGRPRASRADLLFVFKADLIVTVQNAEYNFLQGVFGDVFKFEPSLLKNLDRIPVPIHVVTPSIPDGAMGSDEVRVVTVEFYIDQEGKVRVPSVSRDQVDDQLAAVAVDAVEQWRFEPPMRKGHPVLVLAQQDFRFMSKRK